MAAFRCEPSKQQTIFWDGKTPGLGLRVTAAGAHSFIFETRLHCKTLRITIGDSRTWTVGQAQSEANRYKVLTDQGIDPRQQRAEQRAALVEAKAAATTSALREAVTLAQVWPEYVKDRSSNWSSHHLAAHQKIIQKGGEKRKRSPKLTTAGPLATLANVRLVDLTHARVEAWAKIEAQVRPASARLAIRLLKACLQWCSVHSIYSAIVTTNATKSAKVRETLGKPKVKHDLLQREQLAAWFAGVKSGRLAEPRIAHNQVVSAAGLPPLTLHGLRRSFATLSEWVEVPSGIAAQIQGHAPQGV